MDATDSNRPAPIVIQSLTRRIVLSTALPEEGARIVLCVPDGATDEQVIGWASQALPPEAIAELRERIENES
jgi:hypothetical protein